MTSTPSAAEVPERAFRRVGENLYRFEATGGYYALLKRGDKQFRSLKTSDRKLAERRLADLRRDVGNLGISIEANLSFTECAEKWMATTRHALKPSSVRRRELCISALKPYFHGVAIRHIARHHCDRWLTDRGARIAAQSFAHELGVLKAIFEYAVDAGLVLNNPAAHIRRRSISSNNQCANAPEEVSSK
jgi:hypothetical protein